MDLKDRLTEKVQRMTNRTIYIQELNNRLECIAKGKEKSNPVVFIYNDTEEKTWEFDYYSILSVFSAGLIFAFVCKNEIEEEYHLISMQELFLIENIELNKFLEEKNKKYIFNDIQDKYKDNWKVFD